MSAGSPARDSLLPTLPAELLRRRRAARRRGRRRGLRRRRDGRRGAGSDKVVAFNGKRDTINCGTGRDTAYVDRRDKVKGCEKRIYAKPRTTAKKRRKSKK